MARLFISYSHDSEAHKTLVLRFCERLRKDGFETTLDQYINGSPSQGWPRWMAGQLKAATYVLVICTETYYRRFNGDEMPDQGKGVDWEGALITQAIYDARSNILKFVPVLFASSDEEFIPEPLQAISHYTLTSEDRYKKLLDFLSGVAGYEPGAIGTFTPRERPPRVDPLRFDDAESSQANETGSRVSASSAEKKIAASRLPAGAEKLIGRGAESGELDQALESTRTHIIEFVAFGGVGKTALVVDWMTRLSADNWTGIERYFDWSFYSQGTKAQSAISSDVFIAKALAFFGDPDPKVGSAHDRGNRLAELVAQHRTVLILDGLEPLQYGTGPLRGQLKDPAGLALSKGLAQRPLNGLCVLTTREVLTDLKSFHNKTVVHHPLEHLSNTAGAALLHQSGATCRGSSDIKADDKELKNTSDEVKGHALTLSLLGGYLKAAHGGDIDRRDRVAYDKADDLTQDGHAFRTIAAYEHWLEQVPAEGGRDPEQGPRQVSILRLLGLFDRPASPKCLKALRQAPAIARLTEQLVGLEEDNWNIAVTSLEELDLVSNQNGTLDAHPLVREYFAKQLREEQKKAWTEGHRRLYEHLCETTEQRPATIEGLQPLYQAVAHGCQAGLYEQARKDVYVDRILRGTGNDGNYSTFKLGAMGADLGAVACFFDPPWRRVSPKLSGVDQSWLLNEAGYSLRALGRLTEALEPMRAGLEMCIEQEDWKNAAASASNLSALELTLGELTQAQSDAEQSVTFADRSEDWSKRMINRTTHGDALHQSGRQEAAGDQYVEAETIQRERQPEYPRLYAFQGFRYCDLLLSEAERLAWRHCLAWSVQEGAEGLWPTEGSVEEEHRQACEEVTERATQTLGWVEPQNWLLDIGLDHLTLARAALYRWLIEAGEAKAEAATTLGPTPPGLTEHMEVWGQSKVPE